MDKRARAEVAQIRQTTQFTCCATSIAAALRALGKTATEDDVNRVLNAAPMAGATWEAMLATVQYFGCRGTLVVPSTPRMLKAWTDKGIPVVIAWNPENRPWSHASVVFDVTEGPEGLTMHVMDPNIPNPSKTTRVLGEDEFCQKWGEKVSESLLVRRPAMAVELEVTPEGRQVVASTHRVPGSPTGTRPKTALRQSPNETGSSELLRRQGLEPVDVFFGEARPHNRPLVMQGEGVRDRDGNVWFFVGTGEDGKAILAENEVDLERMKARLVRDRLRHLTVSRRAGTSASRVADTYLSHISKGGA